jgi:hypothetical protein
MFDFGHLAQRVPPEVAAVLELVKSELDLTSIDGSRRREDLLKVRDQLAGGEAATCEKYHPQQYGLNKDQQAHFRRTLRRSHVNLVEPALDRLVNSIHSGKIRRRVAAGNDAVAAAIRARGHASAMARLCENAFAYGTGYLVPLLRDGTIRYWLPDPIGTILVANPADIDEALGIVEVRRSYQLRGDGLGAVGETVVRYVTRTHRGYAGAPGNEAYEEHGLGFVPAVVARGRDLRHQGEVYGRSLVIGVADATIRVTNNEVNLELLRDRQTQALLIVEGEPNRTSADDQAATGKYIQFPKDGGSARYTTPESRLEEVIEVTRRFCEDAAISSGLPLDTFLPSLIAGSDASATAARIRAFPLQQRMARLVNEWEAVEEEAILAVGGVLLAEALPGASAKELRDMLRPEVTIRPSLPEADAETLSNWQQKTTNFMAPIEDAIDFYADHLSEEQKAALARAWALKNDPTVDNGASDEQAKFRREIAKALYGSQTTKEVMANLTDLEALMEAVGLPRDAAGAKPWLPVVAPMGPLVTGEVIRDNDGRIIGGAVAETAGGMPAESIEGASG